MERFTREMPIEDKKWPWWMAKPRGRRKVGGYWISLTLPSCSLLICCFDLFLWK